MNDYERGMLGAIANRQWDTVTSYARVILDSITSERDQQMKKELLRKIKENEMKPFELPMNVRDLLAAQDVSDFREDRFLLRKAEAAILDKLCSALGASAKLKELDVRYVPSLLLTGVPGTGKTLLAKYIAFKVGLPFVYVRFSNLVGSYLGQTQSNVAKVFDFVRSQSAVVCFDEIDAIGLARGQRNDVGEMSRVVIALMQELDRTENGSIIIGTTNRADMLDAALLRRFNFRHEVALLTVTDARDLEYKFFASVGKRCDRWVSCIKPGENPNIPRFSAADVVAKCTEELVSMMEKESNE